MGWVLAFFYRPGAQIAPGKDNYEAYKKEEGEWREREARARERRENEERRNVNG
jgi:hypothetical protein